MIQYAKLWTTIFYDEWFQSLTLIERGVWLQMIAHGKESDVPGEIKSNSWRQLANKYGCDDKTIKKVIKRFEKCGKIRSFSLKSNTDSEENSAEVRGNSAKVRNNPQSVRNNPQNCGNIRTKKQNLTYTGTESGVLIKILKFDYWQGLKNGREWQKDEQVKREKCGKIRTNNNKNIYKYNNNTYTSKVKEQNLDNITELTERLKDNRLPVEKKKCVKFILLFNSICKSLPTVIKLTEARQKKILSRISEEPKKKFWEEYFNRIEQSSFLTGKSDNDRNWSADFDWILEPRNYVKILEGKYDDKKRTTTNRNKSIPKNRNYGSGGETSL